MDEEYAKHLLRRTQENYNRIADHFSKTRSYIPKETRRLTDFVFNRERVLDLGCGSGRLFKFLQEKNIDYIGLDNSEKLIEIAKREHPEAKFRKANALDLPFPANYFDKVLSVAVLHHIPSEGFRLRFLKEARRVLKPGGLLILTVWNVWPTKDFLDVLRAGRNRGQKTFLKYQKRFLRYHLKYFCLKLMGKSKLDFKDIFYPWKNPEGEILARRYIHCFTRGEIKNLAEKAGFEVQKVGYLGKQKANIYLIAKKVSNVI